MQSKSNDQLKQNHREILLKYHRAITFTNVFGVILVLSGFFSMCFTSFCLFTMISLAYHEVDTLKFSMDACAILVCISWIYLHSYIINSTIKELIFFNSNVKALRSEDGKL